MNETHRARLASPLGLALALALTCACQSAPGAGRLRAPRPTGHPPREEPVDVEHLFLDLDLEPAERWLEGSCTLFLTATAAVVDDFELDLVDLEVFSVREGSGAALDHRHSDGRLWIRPRRPLARGEQLEVVVAYGGSPRKGLWYCAERDGVPTQVFTQGECEDARFWFPCMDYPAERATSELRVTMPEHWTSVAAGERIAEKVEDGRRTHHWRMKVPHPSYLVTLVAGEFTVVEDAWDGIPLATLAAPEKARWMEASFDQTDEILAFLSEVTGRRYPYAKYSQACVADFPFGGMENISATTLTDAILTDERGRRDHTSHGLVAHEAAHQWFGDLLTCADWSHIWLNEGFASYMTALYFERSLGLDDFRVRMRAAQRAYMAGDVGNGRRPTVHDVYRDPMDLFFGGHTYTGGAARLHLLRRELGDEIFFAGVRRYVADNAGRGVVTDDLRRAMELAGGGDLTWFFDQWFHSPGFPELEIEWSWSEERPWIDLVVRQVQSTSGGTPHSFDLPLDVEVMGCDGAVLHELRIERREQRFTLPAAERPRWVRFDKYGWVPMRLSLSRTAAQWLAIAEGDDDVNGRRDAVAALGRMLAGQDDPGVGEILRAALVERLENDGSRAVRAAAASALDGARDGVAHDALAAAAAADPEASVRVAALGALAAYAPDAGLAQLARGVFEEGYSWNVMKAAAGLLVHADPAGAEAWIGERLDTPSPHGVLEAGLVEVLGRMTGSAITSTLLERARDPRAPDTVRSAAATALGARGFGEDEVRACLVELLNTRRFRLRQAAIGALGALDDERARRPLEALYRRSVFPRERRTLERILELVP
ncbi:MAG: M1 family metallopeptidase [Planctomycetota bacterium]|nr:M1 family metallopeptidase [Planctomycetota bacterium]